MRSSRSQGPARVPAAVVAVIVLLCQGTAWVHAAAMPHVTCLEHGESVHLPAASGEARDGGLAAVSAPAPTAAHEHDHCNLQLQRTTPVTAPAPAIVVACLALAPAPAAPGLTTAVGLLHFAPKTSPPPAPTR